MFSIPELPFTIPVQVTVSQTQNFALLAVPLFILAGNLLNKAGITERLLELASVLTGRLKGGLAQVSIALSGLMGGVSGSAIGDAAMQARMLGEELVKRGFNRGFAAGVLSFGAVLTPIIPPGIGMILYGTIGQVSIGRLFAAGIAPALLLWFGLATAVWLTAHRRGYGAERQTAPTAGEVAPRVPRRGLGAAVSGVPAARPADGRVHAVRDRRVRRGLCGAHRRADLSAAQAAELSRCAVPAPWRTSARSCS